jgi:hypothetical protein
MPFVVASSYNFLKNLRSMGFKTYCELWDESYDEIKDVIHLPSPGVWSENTSLILSKDNGLAPRGCFPRQKYH